MERRLSYDAASFEPDESPVKLRTANSSTESNATAVNTSASRAFYSPSIVGLNRFPSTSRRHSGLLDGNDHDDDGYRSPFTALLRKERASDGGESVTLTRSASLNGAGHAQAKSVSSSSGSSSAATPIKRRSLASTTPSSSPRENYSNAALMERTPSSESASSGRSQNGPLRRKADPALSAKERNQRASLKLILLLAVLANLAFTVY